MHVSKVKRALVVVGASLALMLISVHQKRSQKRSFFEMSKAFAATPIDAGSLDTSTAGGLANYARYYYYQFNGDSDEYTSDAGSGYLGMVNGFLGEQGLGAVMGELGYPTCTDIPDSGTETLSKNGITAEITFSPGTKTIPSHFGEDVGDDFTKRLVVKMNNTLAFNMEFRCEAGSDVISGYLLLDFEYVAGSSTPFEIYFQQNSTTKAIYLDFATVQSDLKMLARFSTDDGSTFNLYQVVASGMAGGLAIGITGELGGKTQIYQLASADNISDAATNVIHNAPTVTPGGAAAQVTRCLDLSSDSASSGCSVVADPGSFTAHGATHTFSIASISSLALTTLEEE
jgi:hypothetical protein